ncbi:MAG: hypothetical protein RDV48_08455 [Candidatus Eremiobacteraeota bacterium]|nr:hypothetical protein [Candidatus Eremiobacteraeota bacterium]
MRYIEKFLRQRKDLVITVDYHALCRGEEWHVSCEEIEETVRRGWINPEKCREFPGRPYRKIFLSCYFGKHQRTVELVLLYDEEFAQGEVKTLWAVKGRTRQRK